MTIVASAPVPAHARLFDADTDRIITPTAFTKPRTPVTVTARVDVPAVAVTVYPPDSLPCVLLFTRTDWARFAEVIDQAREIAQADPRAATRPVPADVDIPADVRAEWEAERHPFWCDGGAYGCGTHTSTYVYAPATAAGFEPTDGGVLYPAVAVAATRSKTGQPGVNLTFMPADCSVDVSLAEARHLADAGDRARNQIAGR